MKVFMQTNQWLRLPSHIAAIDQTLINMKSLKIDFQIPTRLFFSILWNHEFMRIQLIFPS